MWKIRDIKLTLSSTPSKVWGEMIRNSTSRNQINWVQILAFIFTIVVIFGQLRNIPEPQFPNNSN